MWPDRVSNVYSNPGPLTYESGALNNCPTWPAVTDSSAHSEAEIRESFKEFQFLIVWGKRLDLVLANGV